MATRNIVPRASGEGTLGSSSKLWKEVHHVTSSFGDTKLIEDASNNLQLSGGPLVAASGLSGSLTKLSDGTSYIVASSNMTVASASNGAITLSSTNTNTTYTAAANGGLALTGSSSTEFTARSSIAVTVAGGKFVIDGTSQQTLSLAKGVVYYFDQSDNTNATHPLRFSETSDGTHGGGSELSSNYYTKVVSSANPGSAGAFIQIQLQQDAPSVLYYYCSNHSGMGSNAETAPDALLTGNRIFANDLTVAGSLIVQGTTTTISSSNTTLQDPIIGLGVTGSETFTNTGDRGIIFARGASASSDLPGLWWDGTQFNLAKSVTSPASSSFGSITSYSPVRIGTLTLGGTLLTSTAGELNLLDGGTSVGGSITLANTDGFVVNDAGTMKTIPASDIRTYVNAAAAGSIAADDIAAGDAAVTITTTSGATTINSANNSTTTISGSNVVLTSENDVTVTGDLAVNGDTSTFASANTTDPVVIIKNTTNDANGARLKFVKDKGAAGAANDVAGIIEFFADDANQDQVKFSEIKSQVAVHTNGQEGGKLTLSVAEHDGTLTQGLLISDGDADGEIDVTIGAGASSVTTVSGDLAVNGDTSTFASANSTDPLVIVKNTTNDANGARLRFVKDKGAAGADNDVAGLIEFYADDDNQDNILFAKVEAAVADASNGAEGGKLTLSVATHDGEAQPGLVLTDGSAEDEVDVTIGNGTASVTTVAGDLKVTTNIILDDGGSLTEAGGTTAFTFDGDGHVTKIGQDSPSNGQFLKWDGSKAVWDAASGGSGGGGKHELTVTTGSNFDVPAFAGSTKERQLYIVNSSNAVTATLPNPGATTYDGYEINIKRLGAGIVHITGSVNIDNSHTFDLPSQFSNITLVATGSQYVII